jgi:hypothetical protein
MFFLAARFFWACIPFVFFFPNLVWFTYRMSKQHSVEEVPAPEETGRKIA